MQAILGAVVSVSCFGLAYATHTLLPFTPPKVDLSILETSGTIHILSRESLNGRPVKELVQLYLDAKANLEDVLEAATNTHSISDALNALDDSRESEFLRKAAKKYYATPPKS